MIRANIKQKREKEASEKLKKLREVEGLIARKRNLMISNLQVR